MNIFFLDKNPYFAAMYQVDKHVVKMVLETAQLLSTAWHVLEPDNEICNSLYRKTHANHPTAIWVRQTAANYWWTVLHLEALLKEYRQRYGKVHATTRIFNLLNDYRTPLSLIHCNDRLTSPSLAMPDEYKCEDAVIAYRTYYVKDKLKKLPNSWKTRSKPEWIKDYET